MNDIVFTREGALGVITLARTAALNALTLEMIQSCRQQLKKWEADKTVHAIVLQALPGKIFCAGGDVRWLYHQGQKNKNRALQFFKQEYQLNYEISKVKKPFIALMNGLTIGGGVGISLHGSHRVTGASFSFSMPETGIGLFPDVGASYLLNQCPGKLGVYLGLTGNFLAAEQALAAGLVDFLAPDFDSKLILSELQKLDLSAEPFDQVSNFLKKFSQLPDPKVLTVLLDKINGHFNKNSVAEIVTSLLESKDEWCVQQAEILQKKSPLSLEITLCLLQKTRSFTLLECLQQDEILAENFLQGVDFYEGVRALLIDKDKSPQWSPRRLSEVSKTQVAVYFNQQKNE